MEDFTVQLFPDPVVCTDNEDFVNKMLFRITGKEKTFIPQKPDMIDLEDLAEAEAAALQENAAFVVPSVISSNSTYNTDRIKPYIIVMSMDKKMYLFPYNGEVFSDMGRKGQRTET